MKRITVGIIGAGRIGKVHATSIMTRIPGARVKTIADIYMNEATAQWAKDLGIERTTNDHRDILNDPEIEAVLVCSSTDTHAQMTVEAAEAGKHVFCEKPIDSDVDRIYHTLEVVERAGVKLQVGFNRRFDHNFSALRNAVTAGRIGVPHMIKITSRDPEAPPISYVKVSGGMFMDMTIHDFDMARFLSGSEVEEVYVNGAVLVDPAIGEAGDIDTALISLKFANGAIGVIDNSRRAAYGYDQRAEVFGSEGAAASANDTPSTVVISDAKAVTSEKPLYFFLERYMESFATEMRAFIDAIQQDTPVAVDGWDGLKPVLIAKAAAESLRTGKPAAVERIRKI